jgi:DNA-directed RNA polymerase specialized sigma24 family protein
LADDHCQHRQRARLPTAAADLRRLKPRERRDLYLRALGYRHNEIAELTDATYTAVTRRLTEGRAQLRRLARERDDQ